MPEEGKPNDRKDTSGDGDSRITNPPVWGPEPDPQPDWPATEYPRGRRYWPVSDPGEQEAEGIE